MTILLFFAVLFVLILVHELGHFAVAKWTGMRVDEFGIGFPPRLFGIRKGETLYSLNALPIGGFVQIYGENLDETDTHTTNGRSFSDKSKWAQAAVLIAGVTMNVLFAWVLYTAVFVAGVPAVVDPATASDDARLTVAEVLPESPAAAADIPPGAVITEIRAADTTLDTYTPDAFAAFVTAHRDSAIDITYRAGDRETTTSIEPQMMALADGAEREVVGLSLALIETTHYPLHVAALRAAETSVNVLVAITVGVTNLIVDAVTFDADLSEVAGPVGIVGMVGDAADFGLAPLLMFTALISLNLAVINLLPVPALDGGRLLFVAIEAVIRRPIDPVWAARANTVGFALLLLLMVAVTWNDILRIT